MKLNDLPLLVTLLGLVPTLPSSAKERQWSFDLPAEPGLVARGGEMSVAPGARGNSLALDGATVLEVKDSAAATHHGNGFTCAIWVNPYAARRGQQMIVAKNRYSLDEREWGMMIDKDGRIKLYVWQGKWVIVDSGHQPEPGRWCQVVVRLTGGSADLWINGRLLKSAPLAKPMARTKAPLTFGGVNDNGRIWQNIFGALDEVHLHDRALSDAEIAALYHPVTAVHEVPEPPKPNIHELWSGGPIPEDPEAIPVPEGMTHHTLLDARHHDYKFLHGPALIHHKGTFFANWANSPKNENQQFETLQGRRFTEADNPGTWSRVEVIGSDLPGEDRRSHAVFMKHQGQLWTFAARFGTGVPGERFDGLRAEAFVLNEQTDRWDSKGIVMTNCWPYDEPVRMANGSFITGGQDRDGLPVVAISHGDDVTKWDSVLIPYEAELQPRYAETTVGFDGERVLAVIRGGGGVAWVSTSDDFGRTWTQACRSNFPMPRSKAYLGKLSTGQLYLVSNFLDRDTLVVSVGRPGERTLSSMWRIRHGKSEPPRFPGHAKSKQWSYPYGHEHDGKLHVVYSIGKEDCGLSVIPLESLAPSR